MVQMAARGRQGAGLVMGTRVGTLLATLRAEESAVSLTDQQDGLLGRVVAIALLEQAVARCPAMTLAEFLGTYTSTFSSSLNLSS